MREQRTEREEKWFGHLCVVHATGGTDVGGDNPRQWVIAKAFIFGFAMHGMIAGSRNSRFTLLIRQIFK